MKMVYLKQGTDVEGKKGDPTFFEKVWISQDQIEIIAPTADNKTLIIMKSGMRLYTFEQVESVVRNISLS